MRILPAIFLIILQSNGVRAQSCDELCDPNFWKSNEPSALEDVIEANPPTNVMRGANGVSPLHLAAEFGHEQLLSKLLDIGLDAKIRDTEGHTVLHYAVWGQNEATVRFLLDINADPNATNHRGRTPLRFAAPRDTDVLKALLNAGADPNLVDDLAISPLMAASSYSGDDPQSVELLLEFGANPNAVNSGGKRAINYASAGLFLEESYIKVEALLTAGARLVPAEEGKDHPINSAARSGNDKVIALLLEAGADPNGTGIDKQTPLHNVGLLDFNSAASAQVLISAGSDVNALDENGDTPLHIAARYGAESIIHTLLDNGASGKIVNFEGETAFETASKELVESTAYWRLNDAQFE